MAKQKQLRARVEDDLYERVQLKTGKISDFVREAVMEKLEREEYGNKSHIAVEIKEIELMLENKQATINSYQNIIEREQKEYDRLTAQLKEKQGILERETERKERIKNNPEAKKVYEDTVMFLLRKKYMNLEASSETVITNKARDLGYNNVQDFKDDVRKYVDNEWQLGRKFDINGELKDFIEHDYNYVTGRL